VSARTDVTAGARAIAPILLGIIPFSIITGVAAVEAGIPPLEAIGMSIIIYAGAAQLAAIELIGQTAPVVIIVLTAVVVNLRYIMYSASLAPHFRGFSMPTKWLSAYVLTEQAYAVSITEFQATAPSDRSRKWFYLGGAVLSWVVWQVGTIAGVALGGNVPAGLSFEFAVPLTFMALLFSVLDDRSTEVVALVAGGTSVCFAPLPYNLGLIAAAGVGIATGVVIDLRRGSFPMVERAPTSDDGDSNGDETS
jgi:4-azaleucine resistance transporter AzlC